MNIIKRFIGNGALIETAKDVYCLQDKIVNLYLIGEQKSNNWVLVDCGMFNVSRKIRHWADKLYGPGSKPACIILTHGHFDHTGAVRELSEQWNVPVYAHPLEFPYLNGKKEYPSSDPVAGGGFMSWSSFLFPKKPINISNHLKELSPDGSLPELPGWEWIFTPGHSPGHISLFRQQDKLIIAGDAVVTTKQESLICAFTQKKQVSRPPAYFTPDWNAAHKSIIRINNLQPDILTSGHGLPLRGDTMKAELEMLAKEFSRVGVPDTGKYSRYYELKTT